MKISYRREMKHNYMIVEPEESDWCSYECRMLEANAVEGILGFQLNQTDGQPRFYYEISSKQPLARILENQKIREAQLRRLILSLTQVLDRMERYLLPEGSILLEPEYIYIEPETFSVWLCLIPGRKEPFSENFGKLLEYLLGKVDHQDKDSVVLAYGLFQESRRENYGMQDILRLMERGGYDKEEAGHDRENDKEILKCREEQMETGTSAEPGIQSDKDGCEKKGSEKKGSSQGERIGQGRNEIRNLQKRQDIREKSENKFLRFRETMAELWNRFIHPKEAAGRKKQDEREKFPVQVSWETMFGSEYSEDPEESEDGAMSPEENQKKSGSGDFDDFRECEEGRDTVLLADLGTEECTKLHRLCSLDGESEDIVLSYYPFIIGKQENLVDYMLQKETVSRLHLKIEQIDEEYFIQDLNSTNGTSVSGHLLENNEAARLHPGDEICIARYRYRFE